MTSFAELSFRTSYHKGRDDIANDFYLPAMRLATEYDRAVGYFRSAVFIIAWPALRGFVARGGRMRVLCSQVLATNDIEALDAGYAARVDERIAARLRDEVASLLQDDAMAEPARVLAALVATDVLDLKIAILRRGPGAVASRIFHDKLGIFRDAHGASLVFKGSMNETWSGLAADGNLESVDVACSWLGGRDEQRVAEETAYFADLWADQYPGLEVRRFPDTAREALIAAADPDWQSTLDHLLRNAPANERTIQSVDAKGRILKSHQAAGLADWRAHDRRGILAFATGAGKTFTALEAIREALTEYNEVPVVIVPDKTLFAQWGEELDPLAEALSARILRVGADYDFWRDVLRDWTASSDAERRLVLATVQTARTAAFRNALSHGGHLFLVADEVHRLGSSMNRSLLDESLFGPRLGLSATPERAGDDAGTAAILGFFERVLEPRYTLADAVHDGVLTRYFYRPHTVPLSEEEAVEWHKLARRIARLWTQQNKDDGLRTHINRLLFERARLVKKAYAKVRLAVDVLNEVYEHGQRWIIYCDDQDQLRDVVSAVGATGYTAMPFHSAMEGDRGETLRWLDRYGGIVAAIRCLDEGVDIPSVTHALILASSKNPREFIQRRGRVLRTAPGKALAYVHDAIVVPPLSSNGGDGEPDPITAGELARAIEFARSAENPAASADLVGIAIDAGIDWEKLTGEGVEDLDDD